MAQLPESQHTTSAAIIRWYESKPQEHRPHMGASLIGHNCDRYIWLTWRWALKPEFKGRILRLFSTGQREESRLVEELRGIGATVWDVDPDSGDQWRVSACDGHFGGSLDGVAKGLPEAPKSPAVLEFKTHSNKSFNELVKKTVKGAKAQHYDQMTVYMGLMEIERALYMAVNKDTDDVYCEWVHFDKERFAQLIERAQRLISSTTAPFRMSTDPEFFECKWCSMWKHCHGGQAAEANCRTCVRATPVAKGAWQCGIYNRELALHEQRSGCGDHLLIPDLVPYADAQDGSESWIAYKHKETGDMFVNGYEGNNDYGPVFSSRELHQTNGSLIGDIIKLKLEFPVSKVAAGSTTAAHQDHETMWDDLATHPDDLPVKSDTPEQRKEAKKIKSAVKALGALK
jgi:hypothetical protein